MSSKKQKPAEVVVVVSLEKSSRREFLSGFFDSIPPLADWRPRIVQSTAEFTAKAVRGWLRDGVAGVVSAEPGAPGAERLLAMSSVPLVVIGSRPNPFPGRNSNIAFLHIDDFKVGVFAAEHLDGLGRFRSAIFISSWRTDLWSEMRGRGFASAFARRGIKPKVLEPGESLAEAVDAATKPVAVFAASDRLAQSAVESLPSPRALIPERMALLGVDNDELVCNILRPRLSSILPDHYREGALAAGKLYRMMRAKKPSAPSTTLCGGMKVVTRETTMPLAPSAMLVERAKEFIRRNATSGITPGDVAGHLGVSRRLLDLRFSELSDETVSDAIRCAKLSAVKRLLLSTNAPIAAISRDCGFPNANHLRNIFASATGVSMREWRRRARQ